MGARGDQEGEGASVKMGVIEQRRVVEGPAAAADSFNVDDAVDLGVVEHDVRQSEVAVDHVVPRQLDVPVEAVDQMTTGQHQPGPGRAGLGGCCAQGVEVRGHVIEDDVAPTPLRVRVEPGLTFEHLDERSGMVGVDHQGSASSDQLLHLVSRARRGDPGCEPLGGRIAGSTHYGDGPFGPEHLFCPVPGQGPLQDSRQAVDRLKSPRPRLETSHERIHEPPHGPTLVVEVRNNLLDRPTRRTSHPATVRAQPTPQTMRTNTGATPANTP